VRPTRPFARLWATCLLFVAAGVVIPPPAHAAVISVTTTVDELNSDGDCSLREAITAANTDAPVDNCDVGSEADTIAVPAGTYTLSIAGTGEDAAATGDLDLTAAVTITGAGATETIVDAAGVDRAFHVLGGVTAAISGLAVTGADTTGDGGGILNAGTLTVSDSSIEANSADSGGGIFNSTTLTVTGSTVGNNVADLDPFADPFTSGNGAGIANAGTLTVAGSTISGNDAGGFGGAIDNIDPGTVTVTITDSTLSGNTADFEGGAMRIGFLGAVELNGTTIAGNTSGIGGGIRIFGGTLTVTDSTISGNSATGDGGGILNHPGTLTVTNSTVSGNSADEGGGLRTTGAATLTNATITGNSAADGDGIWHDGDPVPTVTNTIVADNDDEDCNAALSSGGGNLDSDDTCFDAGGTDQVNADADLGPLAFNGGPTKTHALGASSDAIDAGLNGPCPATDQRGVSRPIDGDGDSTATCDVGAYEAAPFVFDVTRADDPAPDGCLPDDCSLREAVIAANGAPGADEITVPAGTYTRTIAGGGENAAATGDLDLTDEVVITGAGPSETIVDADGIDRVFHVLAGAAVELAGLQIVGGSEFDGGGIYNAGTATVTDSTISGNTADDGGGGIFNAGTATVTDSTISGNTALGLFFFSDGGGGIYNAGTATVTDSTISGNTALGLFFVSHGGGMFNAGTATVTDSTVSGNTADVGGGIHQEGIGTLTLTDSTISGNIAGDGDGGGIYTNIGTVTVTGSTISGNTASLGGGGIGSLGTLTVNASTITGNDAPTGAGIAHGSDPVPTVTNTIVADNVTGDDCSAALASGGGNLDSDDTCFNSGGTDLVNADPLFGPLADNGGPTMTHALLPDSPALDFGTGAGCPGLDQRGLDRPVDAEGDGTATCDSGAYEANALSVADASVNEGDSGTNPLTFTVTLPTEDPGQVTVAYTTSAGTATAPDDYAAESGTLTFAPGDTSETVTVDVAGDQSDESNETFTLELSDPVGAVIADASGTGTITDDDFTPPGPAPTPTPTPTPSPTETGSPPIAGCEPAEGDVCGTDGPDTMTVGSADDHDGDGAVEVHLGDGDDVLCIQEGLGLTVTVFGGPGDDHVTVGECGVVFESRRVDDPPTTLIFRAAGGNDSARAGAGNDDLRGGRGQDELSGNGGGDSLRGGASADLIHGGSGRDSLRGGRGRDDLRGNRGRDELAGGRGRDVLNGGGAKDRCTDSAAGTRFVSCEVKPN